MSTYGEYFSYVLQLRYSSVLKYNHWHVRARKSDSDSADIEDVQGRTSIISPFHDKSSYSGQLSVGARRRLLCAIDCALMLAPKRKIYNPVANKSHPFQVSFITLTHSCESLVPYSISYPVLVS